MLVVAPKRANVFEEKRPAKIKNSPRKFAVPGKLILAKVKNKKKDAKIGIGVTSPP